MLGMGNPQSYSDQDCWKIMLAEIPTILKKEKCEWCCVYPKKMLQLKRNKIPQSPSPNQLILMLNVILVLSNAQPPPAPSKWRVCLATKVSLDLHKWHLLNLS